MQHLFNAFPILVLVFFALQSTDPRDAQKKAIFVFKQCLHSPLVFGIPIRRT